MPPAGVSHNSLDNSNRPAHAIPTFVCFCSWRCLRLVAYFQDVHGSDRDPVGLMQDSLPAWSSPA